LALKHSNDEHPEWERLNDPLGKARILTDNPTARGLLAGEIPLVELNHLRPQGIKLPDIKWSPLQRVMFGAEELAQYDDFRKGTKALSLEDLAKRYPGLVELKEVKIPESRLTAGMSGGLFTPVSKTTMQYADSFAKGLSGGQDWKAGAAVLKQGVKPANPIQDLSRTAIRLNAASGGNVSKKVAPLMDELKSVMKVTGRKVPKVPPSDGFKFTPTPDSPKIKVVKNIPKRAVGKKILGAIPVLGAAIDIGMGVQDVLRAGQAAYAGDWDEAKAHSTNAVGHGFDAAIGASVVGEVLNIGANVAGHEGFGSMVESQVFD
jgi:hypothetical protein